MTAIAGLVDGATVWLGGDSANTTDDHELVLQAQAKVFKRGPFIIGGCGSIRWCEWLFQIQPPRGAGMAWLRREVEQSLRKAEKRGAEIDEGDGAIIGYSGALWEIDGGGIYRMYGKIAATGDGGPAAWGSLRETQCDRRGPKWRLRRALEAAESRFANVRRPFRYCHT